MIKRVRILSIVILTFVLIVSLLVSGVADVRANDFVQTQTSSTINKVPDFYAEGTSGSYSLKVSPKGGFLASSGPTINLMPWGSVTTQWSLGTVYIIFLANVTETDFHIAFLYLTNSSSPFILRTFEYQGANLRTLTFDGVQYVFNRFTASSSIPMPKLKLQTKAQSANDLSAFGPELYINGNAGQMVNDTSILRVFPLRVQYFPGTNDYNELWSLLADDNANYYFAVLYMQNSDPSHVIIEHQIRLNDYKRLDGRTFEAKWRKGSFDSKLTVRSSIHNSIVKVDGFPFRTDDRGIVSVYVPRGYVTIEVPNETAPSPDTRLHFSSWSNHDNTNPLSVEIRSALDLTANYKTRYLLTLETEYGGAQGSGWYDQGTNATFAVPDVITSMNGTRRVFLQWTGDEDSQSNAGWLIMNSPKQITAKWKTQFEVKLQLVGVPTNSSARIAVNGQPQLIGGSGYEFWADSSEKISIEVQSTVIQGNTANYNFTELQLDNHAAGNSIIATQPLVVMIVYTNQPKVQSTMTLKTDPGTTVRGTSVIVIGSIPTAESSTVSLSYSADNVNWIPLANITTKNDGAFAYSWKPNATGTYFVKASWSGDALHVPTSQVVSLRVQDDQLPSFGDSSTISKVAQDFADKAKTFPLAPLLLGLAGSLLLLGAAVAAILVPGGPPIVGYFIGSCLIGFVYVFPISAIVLSVKAVRSRRSPSAVWLTPLATIWIVALAMLATNGAFFAAPPLLLQASAVLLISSNTLLTPLAFSLLLAKVVAS